MAKKRKRSAVSNLFRPLYEDEHRHRRKGKVSRKRRVKRGGYATQVMRDAWTP
jgi:hypothetical protein